MITIILSDTHLTHQFQPKLFEKLKKVISQADTVILNGDFWDGYLTTFTDFVTSEWRQLFELLKQKNTIYIYGNHDPAWMCDKRVSLFSNTQTNLYESKQGKYHYHIQHGHLVYSSWVTHLSMHLPLQVILRANLWLVKQENNNTLVGKIGTKVEEQLDIQGDQRLMYYALQHRQPNHYQIFGHTHVKRFITKSGYCNPGKFSVKNPSFIKIENDNCELASL